MNPIAKTSINYAPVISPLVRWVMVSVFVISSLVFHTAYADESEAELFIRAWDAASVGDHDQFTAVKTSLSGYILYPYLQYEDYRNRRAKISTAEMAGFLDSHQDWAFAAGLKTAWLRTLAKKKKWADLVKYSAGVTDAALKCQRLRGQIILKQTEGVMTEAQKLWAVGRSQPDECDPVFAWLSKNDGISEHLAWQRIRLAMFARNRSLANYLLRYVPKQQHRWLNEWQKISRGGYSRMEAMLKWPDNEITRAIVESSLQRLARDDAALAARKFSLLDGHFVWGEITRAALLRDIALYSAVALDEDTVANMELVPALYRDSQLLEWWARFLLSREDWSGLKTVIDQMPEDTRSDERWRYWFAQAGLRSGQPGQSSEKLSSLAKRASYYGFLAADELGLDYNICPVQAGVEETNIDQLANSEGFKRALELRKVKLDNWATAEWSLAVAQLPAADLKLAAALAQREGWHDRVIFALGNSGDLQIYDWRFPLVWEADILPESSKNKLDPAWVYGTIRSESALVETARSSANAIGLMQITPATGRRVAKKHGLAWSGIAQLKTAGGNLPIGTAYMRDLLNDFDENPVLVSGAYNAGPNAVRRWLSSRPSGEAAIWIETLPYFETRDYIPRVLAFTTIYDWRMGGSVKRISGRMPDIDSGKISFSGSTQVACQNPNL